MTYLIDTDARLSKHAVLALSTLTITELRSGWTKEQANWLLPRLYALCSVVPVTKEIAEQAGIWRQEYKSRGLQLGTPDTVIAATAYLSDSPLVTNNVKDYPMPELSLYKYTQGKAA
jgi:predicted nucleic acid-binding protein